MSTKILALNSLQVGLRFKRNSKFKKLGLDMPWFKYKASIEDDQNRELQDEEITCSERKSIKIDDIPKSHFLLKRVLVVKNMIEPLVLEA